MKVMGTSNFEYEDGELSEAILDIEERHNLRKEEKMTQENLAEILDISRSKVSSWETNKRDMTITDAINLANYYEISLDNLLKFLQANDLKDAKEIILW